MEKIKVQICQGTTCFVMGGNAIKEMLAALTEKYADKIDITTGRCLEVCNKNNSFSKAPYVMIDDEIISSANVQKVIETIERKLGK